MADIQPFRRVGYDIGRVGKLSAVVAPPYDVIDQAMQADLYARHPHNVVRLILNRGEPGDALDAQYQRAGHLYRQWQHDGILKADPQPALYVYHQTFVSGAETVTRRAFIARVRLEPFGEGSIFPHERTHAGPKADRLKLMKACRANLSQILALYPDPTNAVQGALEAVIQSPPIAARDDWGTTHELWTVSGNAVIAEATRLMAGVPLFIADGHHRYETAIEYRDELARDQPLANNHPANYVSMACVSMSDPGLVIQPTHRLVRGAPAMDGKELVRRLSGVVDCEPVGRGPQQARQVWHQCESGADRSAVGLYCAQDQSWWLTRVNSGGRDMLQRLAPHRSDAWRALGTTLLHELILPAALASRDVAPPMYAHSIDEVMEALEKGDPQGRDATGQVSVGGRFELAALVQPASVDDVQEISLARERMPPKTTYFFPKVLSGLVINPLE